MYDMFRETIAVIVVLCIFTPKINTNSGLSITPVVVFTTMASTFAPVKFRVATNVPKFNASRIKTALMVQTLTQVAVQLTAPLSVLNTSRSPSLYTSKMVASMIDNTSRSKK